MAIASPKSLASLLQQRSDLLSVLLSQVRLLRQITAVIRNILPEPLSLHCYAANIDGDTLIIGCDSSTWAAKLRYHMPHILNRIKVHREVPNCNQIRVRVQPLDKGKPRSSGPSMSMSEQTAALIACVAHSTTDPNLRDALLRLSRRTKVVKNR